MGHGRATTIEISSQRFAAPSASSFPAKVGWERLAFGRERTEAFTRVIGSATLGAAKVVFNVFFRAFARDACAGAAGRAAPATAVSRRFTSFRRAALNRAAPSQPLAARWSNAGRVNRSAVVLGAVYALALTLALLSVGCAPQPVSPSSGVDRASGTGLQINDHADAILRDLRRMP